MNRSEVVKNVIAWNLEKARQARRRKDAPAYYRHLANVTTLENNS